MADTKLTSLSAITTASTDDLVYIVDDPGGTATSKKITVENLMKAATDQRVEFVVAASDETTDLTTGTAKVTFRAPFAFTLTGVRASVSTAPVGSTIVVDVNNGANSMLSTKLSIDASEKTSTTAATPAVINATYEAVSDDAEITIDIDQVGSSTAGTGLKVTLIGTRT